MPHLLFAYANDQQSPRGFLRALARERKAVKSALNLAEQMGLCEREFIDDASVGEIINSFQQHTGEVVLFHYGGHAGSFDLLLQDSKGDANQIVKGEGLISFLGRQRGLKAVVLNGCHTHQLAESLIQAGIPLVIGTDEAINDQVATLWASRFYQGIGVGLSLKRAFDDAVDEVRMTSPGNDFRRLYLEDNKSKPSDVPWRIHVAPGQEETQQWSLTLFDPLLGLPEPPVKINLPESPFLFFRRYDRVHSPVFFGRAHHIRMVYDRVANPDSPSIILLHGQSGSGKSSLFEAGLVPRLEADYLVRYLRRDNQLGLHATLTKCLEELTSEGPEMGQQSQAAAEEFAELFNRLEEALKYRPYDRALQQQLQSLRILQQRSLVNRETFQGQDIPPLFARWKQIEDKAGRPLIIIMDQVEEVFTQAGKQQSEQEWQSFIQAIGTLFNHDHPKLQGKLILGFRKEFFPEIDKSLSGEALARSSIFLPTLTQVEIEEIVLGLTSRKALREHYQLQIAPELPGLISGELLQQPEAMVAPILQILLTNMWEAAKQSNSYQPQFTIELYRQLKAKWWNLDRFLMAQITKIASLHPVFVEKGLLLDLLFQHTTLGGTAQNILIEQLEDQYAHLSELKALLRACESHLLLKKGPDGYSLSHDTLAPIVRRMYQQSDKYGQRARRILEGRIQGLENKQVAPLDRHDLAQVQQGKKFMRRLWPEEENLLVQSEKVERRRKRQQIGLLSTLGVLGLMLITAALIVYQQQSKQLKMELSLQEMETTREILDKNIQARERELDQAGLQLSGQKDSISQLAETTLILNKQMNRTISRAEIAEQHFYANQKAADALAFLQDGKKYEALQAIVAAYQHATDNPVVLGALLKVVYDPNPVIQPMSKNYHPIAKGYSHQGGLSISQPFTGFEVIDQSGDIVFNYVINDFVDTALLINGYSDRAYFSMSNKRNVIIWAPIIPQHKLNEGYIIGLEPNLNDASLSWATASGQIGMQANPLSTESFPSYSFDTKIQSLCSSPDGQYIVVAQPTALRPSKKSPLQFGPGLAPENSSLEFLKVRFSSDGRYLVACQNQGRATVYIWKNGQMETAAVLINPEIKNALIVDAVFSPDERFLITLDNASQLHLWDWQQGKHIITQTFPNLLNVLAFTPDNKHLAVGCANGQLYFFPWKGKNTSFSLQKAANLGHPIGVTDIAFSKGLNPKLAVAAGSKVHYYQWKDKLPIWTFDTRQSIQKIAFSVDGDRLWVGTSEGLLTPLLVNPDSLVKKILQLKYLNPES
ncbi:MAG: hypothetical protein DHS20C18_15170 [Saprospiraceae bacterium]|nr:MAG: hypothetical protein DHS20C18_15170 [Saprospiraceae bacterium]